MISSTPSDAILAALREAMTEQGLNSASLARLIGEDRKVLRRGLGGQSPLSLDAFVKVLNALGVSPEALPWKVAELPAQPLREAQDDGLGIDPFGIQGEQAFRLGFALGVDFLFVARTELLGESGIPKSVLEQWPEEIVLKLDAAYHRHNAPQFSPEGVSLNLSFDTLYSCFLPWASIQKVVFNLEAPEPFEGSDPEPPPKKPGLRLVKG